MSLQSLTNVVIIQKLSDFPAPSAGVIKLEDNLTYFINGSVNIGTNQIERGASNIILGEDKSNDKLIYTGTSAMFIDGTSGTNQDITFAILTIVASAVGGSVFSISGTTYNCEIRDCIFGGCNSLGTITSGNILSLRNNLITSCSGGLSIIGNSGYLGISDCIFLSNSSTITCITISSGTFIEISLLRCIFDIVATQTALNISLGLTLNYGVISNCDFNGVGTNIVNVNFLSPNWVLKANRGVMNTILSLPRAVDRSTFFVRATDNTRISSGITTTAFGSTGVSVNDNTTNYYAITSGNASGSFASLESTSFTEMRPDYSPELGVVMKTDTSIASCRYWIGFVSATMTNADNQAGSYAAFRYSTVAGDTGWRAIVSNGTTQTVSTNIGTVAVSTVYKFEIRIDFANSATYFRVNGGTWVTVNAIPLSGSSLGFTCGTVNTTSGARVLDFSRLDGSHN